jgi:hypothetical protein
MNPDKKKGEHFSFYFAQIYSFDLPTSMRYPSRLDCRTGGDDPKHGKSGSWPTRKISERTWTGIARDG